LTWAVGAWAVTSGLGVIRQASEERYLADRAEAVRADLAEALGRSLAGLEAMAALDRSGARNPVRAGERLALFTRVDPLVDWAGLARLDGTVAASSHGDSGESAAFSPWFTAAQDQAALTVTESGGLALSAPTRDRDGSVTGVIGARVPLAALRTRLYTTADALGVGVTVFSASGRSLFGTGRVSGLVDAGVPARVVQFQEGALARAPSNGPGGSAIALHGVDLPGIGELGWRIVVATPPSERASAAWRTVQPLAAGVALSLLVTGLAAVLYVQLYARPLSRLSETARQIAAGRLDVYPYESRRTAEAAHLSAALSSIQLQLAASDATAFVPVTDAGAAGPTAEAKSVRTAKRARSAAAA
jgi:hypothetical protein